MAKPPKKPRPPRAAARPSRPKVPPVPRYEPINRPDRDISPGPRAVVEGKIIEPTEPPTAPPTRRPASPPTAPPTRRPASPPKRNDRRDKTGQAIAIASDQASQAAQRAAIRQSGAPPTVTGRAGAGALAGAGTGAALGGAVGGPVGAAVGAGVGAAGGGVSGALSGARERRAWRRAMMAPETLGARRLLVAEFALCMLIVAALPLTRPPHEDTPTKLMRQMSALALLFICLGLLSAAGRSAARVAAAFGGLVTVALVFRSHSLIGKVAEIFSRGAGPTQTTARRIPAAG